MTENLLILFLALVLDRIAGDPVWMWNRIPHPVVLFGRAISLLDRLLNDRHLPGSVRKRNGVVAITLLLASSLAAGWVIHAALFTLGALGILVEILLVAIFLAQKSLSDHVAAVADGLRSEGLEGGRKAVSMIVGRDPQALDEPGICRAAIESLAENFSDGVVAPAFWYAFLGLPGLLAYKMLNTADSMIGHKSEKYLDFGWASARLDDLANWPAARLSILLLAAGAAIAKGSAAARNALRVALHDNGLHRSPNSGWPEAAMAGALDIQLAGPRIYDGTKVSEPMINGSGRGIAGAHDLTTGIAVFQGACSTLAMIALVLFLVFL